jgi:hypothetical protein
MGGYLTVMHKVKHELYIVLKIEDVNWDDLIIRQIR